MAGTSARRWALLRVGLIAMVAMYDELPTETLRTGPPERLWKCLSCQRVERTALWKPRCYGPEEPHPGHRTQLIDEGVGVMPTDSDQFFR
jgi:hypothetical protein